MFDPDKVERIRFRDGGDDPWVGRFVHAEDYEALLALYRECLRDKAQIQYALEQSEAKHLVTQTEEKCGKDNPALRNGLSCVKPMGHEGHHEDSCRCWWR